MKNLTRIYIPMVFGLFLMLSSCAGDLDTTGTNDGDATATDKLVVEGAAATPDYKICNACPDRPTANYEIPEACADCMRHNFELNNNEFPPLPGGQLVKGFRIHHLELAEMLVDVVAESNSKVYAMMGIKVKLDSLGEEVVTPDIYHQVQSPDRSDASGLSYTSVYYDFSSPCPTFCPK